MKATYGTIIMTKISKINFLFGIIVLFSLKQFSWANDTYIKVDYGIPYYDKLSDDYENSRLKKGQFYGIGVGYKFNNKVRSDVTLFRLNDAKFSYKSALFESNFNVNSTIIMGNLYYDFLDNKTFNIYTGLGAGFSKNTASMYLSDMGGHSSAIPIYQRYNHKNTNDSFAYSFTIGTSMKVTNSSFIDLGYKYYNLGKIKHKKDKNLPISQNIESKHKIHVVSVGLRILI